MGRTDRLGSLATAGAVVAAALVAREALARAREAALADKTVLIIGGSRGLGLLLARRFAAEGARVAICARDPEGLERALLWLADRGHDALAMQCDASRREEVQRLVERVNERLGDVDILVNNAAVMQVGDLSQMTIEDFEQAHASAFWATLLPTLAVLPQMRRRGEGRIVNITSIGGRLPGPHLTPYTAAKFAAVGLSETLHVELARHGIAVTTVVPWFMRTGSYFNAIFKDPAEAEFSWFALGASLPGLSMDAERAAARVVQATKRGEADVALGWPAWLGQRVHGLAPGLTVRLAAFANHLVLPRPQRADEPQAGVRGEELGHTLPSHVDAATSWGKRAAEELNERQDTPPRRAS